MSADPFTVLSASRPLPTNPEERRRWEITAPMHLVLTGDWSLYAAGRLHDFFDPEVAARLPPPELSRNPMKSLTAQKTDLYDDPPQVAVAEDAEADLSHIVTDDLWPLSQERLYLQEGLQECWMRLDWTEGVGVTYRVVPPHHIEVLRAEEAGRYKQAAALRELRVRELDGQEVWTWETWDVGRPASGGKPAVAPVFRIEQVTQEGGKVAAVDVTQRLMPSSEWPYHAADGAPVLPYVLYHARVSNALHNPERSQELYLGTLTVAVLWTWWLAGIRDSAYPLRYSMDAEVKGWKTRQVEGRGQKTMVVARDSLLQFKSAEGKAGGLGQLDPSMDPKTMSESIEAFEAGLAQHAGLNPSDVTRGTSGASGYSIVVSRKGLEGVRKRLRPPSKMGDRLLLATAAKLHNAYGLAPGEEPLPESPGAYQIRYAEPERSPDEVRADTERSKAMIEAGLESPLDAVMRVHRLDRSAAIRKLLEIRRIGALLASKGEVSEDDFDREHDSARAREAAREALEMTRDLVAEMRSAGLPEVADALADLEEQIAEVVGSMAGDGEDVGFVDDNREGEPDEAAFPTMVVMVSIQGDEAVAWEALRREAEAVLGQAIEPDFAPHITLLYLGKVGGALAAPIETALAMEAAASEPIEVVPDVVDVFPVTPSSEGRTPVIVRLRPEALTALHDRLRRTLRRFITADLHPYVPHITLGYASRPVSPEQRADLERLDASSLSFTADTLTFSVKDAPPVVLPLGGVA